MEHRYSERVVTAINAVIRHQGAAVALGRIRDCSKTGFFIETDYRDAAYLQHLDIEIQGRRRGKPCRYRTQVVRRCDKGLGLEIEASDSKSAAEILESILETGRYGQYTSDAGADSGSYWDMQQRA